MNETETEFLAECKPQEKARLLPAKNRAVIGVNYYDIKGCLQKQEDQQKTYMKCDSNNFWVKTVDGLPYSFETSNPKGVWAWAKVSSDVFNIYLSYLQRGNPLDYHRVRTLVLSGA